MYRKYFGPLKNSIFGGFLLLGMIFVLAPQSQAKIIHVRAGAGGGNGSLANPYGFIQMGVNNADPGDSVLVYEGTYYETIKFENSGLEGTDGTIYYIYVIAAGDGPAVVKAQDNFAFLVNYQVDYIWIEGFHITLGYGTTTAHGSGIRTFGNYGVFIYNYIYDNDVGVFSEGTWSASESANNRGNYIAHNVISNSGEAGVRIKHSSDNEVAFNLLYMNGFRIEPAGAVTFYCGYGNRVINNTFWNNGGPAIHAYNGTGVDSCVASEGSDVRDNILARPDNGILLRVDKKTADEGSSVFWYNLFYGPNPGADLVSWGADEWNVGGVLWTLSEFVSQADSVNPQNGLGTFFANPQFASPEDFDFDLMDSSRAINAGSRSAADAQADLLTALETQELDIGIVDLGYHHRPLENGINPQYSSNVQVFVSPNPYSGSGNLKFTLNLPNVNYQRRITGEMFDLQGRRVLQFRVPDNSSNTFNVRWNAQGLTSGIYFILVNVNGAKASERILILK